MKKEEFDFTLKKITERQLDMCFWKFSIKDKNKMKKVKGVKINCLNTSKVITEPYYKIIRF
jgi:hypothetical protein